MNETIKIEVNFAKLKEETGLSTNAMAFYSGINKKSMRRFISNGYITFTPAVMLECTLISLHLGDEPEPVSIIQRNGFTRAEVGDGFLFVEGHAIPAWRYVEDAHVITKIPGPNEGELGRFLAEVAHIRNEKNAEK